MLCIPTAFCSYTGEALDKKTPLLRSMSAIEEQANRVLALFGWEPQRVVPTVGAEQEYFLISEKDYAKRQDLVMCGRTLFGYAPCKGQELEEHYFGAIRPTVNEFMKELDDELWALGVPARTKHNEVAPAQHELAPIFTNANRGCGREPAHHGEDAPSGQSHYGLVCLLHEKPFEGINGSGKHNNWSLSASKNLFDPGESPMDNLRFLVFLTAVIQAVDDYQELLRMSVASAGNDHRLGADEAPPAIVSIFLGDELDAIVDALVDDHEYESAEKVAMDLGVDVLPNFLKDNTDRNRTSPVRVHGQQVRVPHARLEREPVRREHDLEHRRGEELQGLRRRHGGQGGRRVRDGSHRLHPQDAQGPPAHHLQRQRLFGRMGARGRAPRAGEPPHHGRCAAVLRGPEEHRAVRRSSGCSPRPRSAAATR